MFQGPSAGPSMLLNVMMRWPVLIPIAAISGIGVYKYQDLRELIELPSTQQAITAPVKSIAREAEPHAFEPISHNAKPSSINYVLTSTSLKKK